MPEIDLDKLSPELRAAIEKETAPKPERRDTVGVHHVYDPDDAESVTKGYKRGHLTDDDLTSWGWGDLLTKLKAAAGGGDGGDGGDGGEGGEKPPRGRSGYFPDAKP